MSRLILPGRTLELAYPTHNLIGLPLEFAERTVDVLGVSDFSMKPLDIRWLFKRPMVRRGRVLIDAIDQLTRRKKRFWQEACRGQELPQHRLGLYDPQCHGELVDWIGRPYSETRRERLKMLALASLWLDRAPRNFRLRLAVYTVPENAP